MYAKALSALIALGISTTAISAPFAQLPFNERLPGATLGTGVPGESSTTRVEIGNAILSGIETDVRVFTDVTFTRDNPHLYMGAVIHHKLAMNHRRIALVYNLQRSDAADNTDWTKRHLVWVHSPGNPDSGWVQIYNHTSVTVVTYSDDGGNTWSKPLLDDNADYIPGD